MPFAYRLRSRTDIAEALALDKVDCGAYAITLRRGCVETLRQNGIHRLGQLVKCTHKELQDMGIDFDDATSLFRLAKRAGIVVGTKRLRSDLQSV